MRRLVGFNEGSPYELIAILKAAETNLDKIETDQSVENSFVKYAQVRDFISQVTDKIDREYFCRQTGRH